MGGSVDIPMTIVLETADGGERVVGTLDARRPDLAMVDALARLQLCARRRGLRLRLRDVTPQLEGLLDLVGLGDVLALEARRQPELGEELREDEVMEPGDPSV
jgi:hypothetical protein